MEGATAEQQTSRTLKIKLGASLVVKLLASDVQSWPANLWSALDVGHAAGHFGDSHGQML